jgi:hypothetical protein
MMPTIDKNDLDKSILTILKTSPEPLTIPQIQEKLARTGEYDTFEVRDAVWRLIERREAKFTPKRYVEAVVP